MPVFVAFRGDARGARIRPSTCLLPLGLLLPVLLISRGVCAQDEAVAIAPSERIAAEVAPERIAEIADDLELLDEFVDNERLVAVPWKDQPRLGQTKATGPWLITLMVDDESGVTGSWPKFVTEVTTVQVQRLVPQPETRTRTISVTKMRYETKTREVPYTETTGDGQVITKTRTETYQVTVPYTEQVEQTYTVRALAHVTSEHAATVIKATSVFGALEIDALPLFRGDRRAATWQEFIDDGEPNTPRDLVLFLSFDSWTPTFDDLLDQDAFVVVADPQQVQPIMEPKAAPDDLKTIESFPRIAFRSTAPEHQFPLSPYVTVSAWRPGELPERPLVNTGNLEPQLERNLNDLLEQSRRVFHVEMDPVHWRTIQQGKASLLAVEDRLAGGKPVIVSDREVDWTRWSSVLVSNTPVYVGEIGGDSDEVADQLMAQESDAARRRSIDALFACRSALEQNDALQAAMQARSITSTDLLDPALLNQIAFQLYSQGNEPTASEFLSAAMRLGENGLDRDRLIRNQGNSRDWLEGQRMLLSAEWEGAERNNQRRLTRMTEIQTELNKRLMSGQ